MRNEKWIFQPERLCIWSDWKSLNLKNCFEDFYIKFMENEVVEIS